MGWWERARGRDRGEGLSLYAAVVERARAPHWYREGGVPDTVDGRFDMVAAVLSLVLLRLEAEPGGAAAAARLTERFVTDMDGQLREIGVGDVVVGKQVGRMMGMLGGRLGAYRTGLEAGDLDAALVRNLYRGVPPPPSALAHVRAGLLALNARLAATPLAPLTDGAMP